MSPSSSSSAKKNEPSEAKQAEQEVKKSTAEFETAMERLEEKVDDTSRKVQRTVDLAKKPQQIMSRAMSKARTKASPYLSKAKDSSRQISQRVKENPKSFAMGALAVVGALLAGVFFFRKRKYQNRSGSNVIAQEFRPRSETRLGSRVQ